MVCIQENNDGWRSCTVCEGYIDISIEKEKKTPSKILGGDPGTETSTASSFNPDSNIVRREILNTRAVTDICQQNLSIIKTNETIVFAISIETPTVDFA